MKPSHAITQSERNRSALLWLALSALSIAALIGMCALPFAGVAGKSPLGGRAHLYLFLLPMGWTGPGPPMPYVSRQGDRLVFHGFRHVFEEGAAPRNIAAFASDPYPSGIGLTCPVVWIYPYGHIQWDETAFPVRDQERMRSEIDSVRQQIANAIATERATMYHVPTGYYSKYAQGEGAIWYFSLPGIAINLVDILAIVTLIFWSRRGFKALREYRAMKNQFICRCCGYDLRGNVTGLCPECGTQIPEQDILESV